MAKVRIKELAKTIYISISEETSPTAYRIWKELKNRGEKVTCRTVTNWIKKYRDGWEELRQKTIQRSDIKLSEELSQKITEKQLKTVSSLSDIKDNLLKEFEHIDGKSKEGVTRALIELEKALKDKTTSFTPPTSIIIKPRDAQSSIKGEEKIQEKDNGKDNLNSVQTNGDGSKEIPKP